MFLKINTKIKVSLKVLLACWRRWKFQIHNWFNSYYCVYFIIIGCTGLLYCVVAWDPDSQDEDLNCSQEVANRQENIGDDNINKVEDYNLEIISVSMT